MINFYSIINYLVPLLILGAILYKFDSVISYKIENKNVIKKNKRNIMSFIDYIIDEIKNDHRISIPLLFYSLFNITAMLTFFLVGNTLYVLFLLIIANIFIVIDGVSYDADEWNIFCTKRLYYLVYFIPIMIMSLLSMYIGTGSLNVFSLATSSRPAFLYLPGILIANILLLNIVFERFSFESFSIINKFILYLGRFSEYSLFISYMYLFFGLNIIAGIIMCCLLFVLEIFIKSYKGFKKFHNYQKSFLVSSIIICFINLFFLYLRRL